MIKHKRRIITRAAIKEFFVIVVAVLLGAMIALVLSMSLQLYQLTRSIAIIESYLQKGFAVEPEEWRSLSQQIQKLEWVSEGEANIYAWHICFHANKKEIDKRLIYWLIYFESRFKKNAVSEVDCLSLMQLNPKIFKEYTAEELQNPKMNIGLGVAHFADCKARAKGNREYAIRLWHGDPRDPRSIKLGRQVMKKYREGV